MTWTFDGFLVEREHFGALATSLATFDRERPTTGVTHLRAVADTLTRILESEPDVTHAAFWQTTVSGSPWRVYDPDSGDDRPYDLERDDKHFFYVPGEVSSPDDERDEGSES